MRRIRLWGAKQISALSQNQLCVLEIHQTATILKTNSHHSLWSSAIIRTVKHTVKTTNKIKN